MIQGPGGKGTRGLVVRLSTSSSNFGTRKHGSFEQVSWLSIA